MKTMQYDGGVSKRTPKSGGYMALMATIIISVILLVMTVEQSSAGWYLRFNILGTEAKEQANALAEGCADQALASILTNPGYVGDEDIASTGGTCHIYPVEFNTPVPGLVTIKTQAEVRDAYANLEISMDMAEIHLGTPIAGKGTLIVVTQVINDGTGSAAPSAFAMQVAATNASPSTFPGSDTGVVVVMDVGAYTVTETAATGYTTSVSPNCLGTISAGQIKFCTITNDDIFTSLTLIANVTNDNNGTNVPANFSLFIDGAPVTLGTRTVVTGGAHTGSATTLAGYAVSPWGYDCAAAGTVTVATGQSKTCVISFNDLPPPAPSCADTVMILDRTGSQSSADLINEHAAALALNSLYAGVLPPALPPHLGVGSIGGLDGSAASVPLLGQLSILYANIASTITSITGSNSSVGSDLSAGITAASNELNSVRHVPGNEKVLILVSDGDPNEPSGTTAFNTGYSSPSADAQNGGSDLWSSPASAYADGGTDASDLVSENDRHRLYNFGFGGGAGLPSSASITGIEVKADAWATTPTLIPTPGSVTGVPTATAAPNQWTNSDRAFTSNNSYATESTSNESQGYRNFNLSAVPAGATITGIEVRVEALSVVSPGVQTVLSDTFGTGSNSNTPAGWSDDGSNDSSNGTIAKTPASGNDSAGPSGGRFALIAGNGGYICRTINTSGLSNVQLSYQWRGDTDAENNEDVVVEYRTSGSCSSSSSWVEAKSHELDDGDNNAVEAWAANTVSLPANSNLILRFHTESSSSNESLRIDDVTVTGTTLPPNTSCRLEARIGDSGTFSSYKTATLTSTEAIYTLGSSGDDWDNVTWSNTDFTDANFRLETRYVDPDGNCDSSATASLDAVTVQVYYTAPLPSTLVACQLGVDLSWNGGSNWSSEKTQALTGTEATYTLGASNDDWGSHNWTPGEFSNTNFRARVHAIDPGAGCDNAAIDHLDWLQARVHYTQNVDPIEAALNAADAAKLADINLFTIHFGDDVGPYAGMELLANLASGATPITYSAGHQNGSVSNGSGGGSGNTGTISPTSQAPDTGGSGNGFESNPTNAFADGGGNAANNNGASDRHRYYGYNFTIPPGATITGIATRLDWWLDSNSGTNSLGVELSWNGGTSWSSVKSINDEPTNSSNSDTLGGSSDTWGSHVWTAADFTSSNFRVRLTSNSTSGSRDFFLDFVPVTVYYTTTSTENGDGDNFFIAPTSAGMQSIFNFIGEQVCPASLNLASPPPPTTGTLLVITQVVNNNGGSKLPADFTANVSATNPSPTSFAGSVSGVSVTIDPGVYSITETTVAGYNEILGATCSGTIVAGETRVCMLINDDIPPPPPPPDFNINTGSWQEIPTS